MIALLLTSMVSLQGAMAQTPQLNEEKYWEYRHRLVNEYMTGIGPDMGMSLPASIRDTVSGILQWTDCTMAHGEYLAVLATEYRILEAGSVSTAETVQELFYALYALNRLDYTAEPFFGGIPSLNGFFIRDDIHQDSLDMQALLARLNQGLPEYKILGFDSDYMDEIPRNNEESLDQAILLLTGLSMVRKCVPEGIVYEESGEALVFQDFETSLSREAGNIITRIVNYMKEGDSVTVHLSPSDPNLYGIQGDAWDFIIKNPVTMQEVMRGPNAFFLSKGYTSAKYHSTGMYSPTTDLTADTITDSIFIAFENYIVPNDQDFKVINLNAMANFWPEGLQDDSANTTYNARVLGPRAKQQYYEWIPMLHQLMFEGGDNYLMSAVPPDTVFYNDPEGYYEYLLNLAPPEGPYNYGNGIFPNWEWSSSSRTIQPARRGDLSTPFTGNYNGLDYMLYYNMYMLLFADPVSVNNSTHMNIRVFPNPFTDKLIIENAGGEGMLDFSIAAMNGTLAAGGKAYGQRTAISTAGLAAGIYLLRIRDSQNNIYSRKLIKQP